MSSCVLRHCSMRTESKRWSSSSSDELLVEGRAASRRAEGAVLGVPAGAAGDLAELGGVEPAVVPAVELAVSGEGDVIDVEVQPHADGVGGDDVVDVAGLVHVDLGVAGARRQGAQHHGSAAALAADPLGDGVDLLRREGDDGRARRQARNLLLAGEGQLRHAGTCDDVGARQQRLQRPLHRAGADQQRFLDAATVQQAVGEGVSAVEVGGELDLVDGDEGEVEVARHRLDGADPVSGRARLDLLLAGDQRHGVDTDLVDDAIVDLARQQTQRQADHAGTVCQHALDGVMRLAGVGRPQHQRDTGGAVRPRRAGHGKREVHRAPAVRTQLTSSIRAGCATFETRQERCRSSQRTFHPCLACRSATFVAWNAPCLIT